MTDERSDVERWLAGECERPSDEAIKHALGLFVGIAMQGMNGTARLAMAAERRLNEVDTRWSLNPWVLGYQAGEAATDQRYQQALSHVANALRWKAAAPDPMPKPPRPSRANKDVSATTYAVAWPMPEPEYEDEETP